jgi:hypothetical protein
MAIVITDLALEKVKESVRKVNLDGKIIRIYSYGKG